LLAFTISDCLRPTAFGFETMKSLLIYTPAVSVFIEEIMKEG